MSLLMKDLRIREKKSCLLLQKMDAFDTLDNGMWITAVGGHNL
jgi:hypothetical protein